MKRTVFVVGAGGSCDSYGLPAAGSLASQARSLTSQSDIYQTLAGVCDGNGLVDETLNELKGHPGQSIDAFLRNRPHRQDILGAGKALLAVLLGQPMVTAADLREPQRDDWFRHIVNKIAMDAPRARDFAALAANIAFVTFNFDSIIETQTAALVQRTYSGDEDAEAAIRSLRVIHVHGRLSEPPNEPLSIDASTTRTGYTYGGISAKWIEWTKAARDEIRIVSEEIDATLVQSIQQLVGDAETLCFLGFNYDKPNLDKLGVPNSRWTAGHLPRAFGSAYGMTPGSVEQARDRFEPVSINLVNAKCLVTLEQFNVLRD
jgi:hypothetical protein